MRTGTHWLTSDELVNLRLAQHDAGTGLSGLPLGVVNGGAPFVFDPFAAYRAGLVSNPNVVVAGAIGAGKSTAVKMVLARGLAEGRRALVIDPKGEYEALAAHYPSARHVLGASGWFDPFATSSEEILPLVYALLGSAQGGALSADQLWVIDTTWRTREQERPVRVLETLYRGLRRALTRDHDTPERRLAVLLYRFVEGDLAGLFDGTGAPVRPSGRLVVLDLSRQWRSATLGVAALAAIAAAQRLVEDEATSSYIVVDEAWSLLSDPESVRWLQGSWKLARARGLSHVLVLHRWSDVAATGDEGSAHRERASGLLRECESMLLLRQPPDEASEMANVLALDPREAAALTRLRRGELLVRFGPYRSLVRLQPTPQDWSVIDTDGAMRQ